MKNIIKQYYKPTAIIWRIIGDLALVLIPVVTLLTFSNPNWNDYKQLIYVGLVIIKVLTNFSVKTEVPATTTTKGA